MKEILLIGGPKSVQGVDRIDDDLMSILAAEGLYDRKAVVVWPTENFLQLQSDSSRLESYLDMNLIADSLIEHLVTKPMSVEAVERLRRQALCDTGQLDEIIVGEAINESVYRLSKLVLAVSGGQNLVVVLDDAPAHAVCWTALIGSWVRGSGVPTKNYDTNSKCYGILNSVKEWSLEMHGLPGGEVSFRDLVPMDELIVQGRSLPRDESWYVDEVESLAVAATIQYPVTNRFGKPMSVQVNAERGYMLVVPKPDKPRNFILGLKTGGAKSKPVDAEVETKPQKAKASTDKYMTRKEVAGLLSMTTRTVDRRVDDGKLKTIKVEGKVLILKSSVDALLGKGEVDAQT